MLAALVILSTVAWGAVIVSQDVTVALIAATSSTLNVWLASRIHRQAKENSRKIDEVRDGKRLVVTRTDRGILITDEELRELQPRGGWDWPGR